jgi:hypothetical protein
MLLFCFFPGMWDFNFEPWDLYFVAQAFENARFNSIHSMKNDFKPEINIY